MSERLILCGEAGRHSSVALRLALDGDQRNVTLKIEDVARRMAANVPPVFTDLLEVAAFVHCADQATSRGGPRGRNGGQGWRRKLRFVIPVRDPDLWSASPVTDSLGDALSFLSEDSYSFEFTERSKPPPFQSYIGLDPKGPSKFEAKEVVLFSGGMDSLGGAVEQLARGGTALLVSHRAASKVYDHQRYLADELRSRYPGRVFHVPVEVTRHGNARAVEYTQRSRSFLFAAMAAAVGHMAGCKRILFCENGIVSINLPLSQQVVGARATRTTHPRALNELSGFLSALLGSEVEVENPFLWLTRRDVVERICASGHGDLLRHTVSCSRVRSMTRLHTHCGTCFQCLDRRFATLAAGKEAEDPEEMYRAELLTGEREPGETTAMAESYLRHNLDLRRMSDLKFQAKFAAEIARVSPFVGGATPDEAAKAVMDLYRRHAAAVHDVLTAAVQKHADALVGGTLAPNCILRMAVGSGGVDVASGSVGDASENDLSLTGARTLPGDCPKLPEIRFAVDPATGVARVQGVPEPLTGAGAALLAKLAEHFRADLVAGRMPEKYRYVRASTLAAELSITEPALRRRVMRVRREVTTAVEQHCGLPLSQNALLETKGWRGYRLNPNLRLVAVEQWPG